MVDIKNRMNISPSKKVFETDDLLRMIYSFGEPSHRIFMKEIKKEIELPELDLLAQEYQEIVKQKTDLNESYNFNNFVGEMEPVYAVYWLKKYSRCYCCQRHSILKPFICEGKRLIPSYQVVFESKPVGKEHKNTCKCSCRQNSRFIMNNLMDNRLID